MLKKILAFAIMAITLSCASDDHVDKCMEINAKYDKLVGLATYDHSKIQDLETARNLALKAEGCIK